MLPVSALNRWIYGRYGVINQDQYVGWDVG